MSVTPLVWLWPDGSTQTTVICWPESNCSIRLVSDTGDDTACPFTEVITSPAARPAVFAGVLQNTPSISAPDFTGAILFGMIMVCSLDRQPWAWLGWPPNPLFCWSCKARWCRGLGLAAAFWPGTMTPRNPLTPVWIPVPLPDWISLVIEIARLIGIA